MTNNTPSATGGGNNTYQSPVLAGSGSKWKYEVKDPTTGMKPNYKPIDEDYMKGLQVRLASAVKQRNQVYEEFNNNTYIGRYMENRRKSNSVLPAKKNEGDVQITTGTLEQKLDAVLSAVNNLNLNPEVHAYDKDNNRISLAGEAIEDVMEQVAEYDEDEEKKVLRQKELLIQGEVFVEEKWVQYFKKKKTLGNTFTGTFDNEWTERLEKFYEGPTRLVKYGPNIYLGDITQFEMRQQPFFFEVYGDGYENLKSIFGKWEMWKYVPRKFTPISSTQQGTSIPASFEYASTGTADYRWLLDTNDKDQCEVIVYQDRWNDEFNIIINGIMMLPAGFPLSAISPNGEYTIEKQVFKPVNAHFAYGRGFIQTAQSAAILLDEMLKLAIQKNRRSFMPPFINTSKRAISPRVLQAGQITMGISPESLVQIGDLSEGVTPSEFQMIKQQMDLIDKMTVSPQFAGQQGKSNTTATEIMELKRQAQMTLGLIVFACAMLEKKIGYLRLWNILENWMKPLDKSTNGTKFRVASRERDIPGEGRGQRQIIPTEGDIPSSAEIRLEEFKEEDEKGFPVKKIYLKPEELKNAVKNWYIIVSPKEKESSDFNKALFREKLNDAVTLTQFGSMINAGELENEFTRVWGGDTSKLFQKQIPGAMNPAEMAAGGKGPDNAGRANTPGIPTTENVA